MSQLDAVRSLLFLGLAAVYLLKGADDCNPLHYRGFDSRLDPALMMPLPQELRISGFEVWNGHPAFASGSKLLVPDKDHSIQSLDLGSRIQSVMVDGAGRLSIRTPVGYWLLATDGFSKDELLSAIDRRIVLLSSGMPTYLGVAMNQGTTAVNIVNRKGESAKLFSTREPVVAASWSAEGMAVIAGTRLIIWDGSSSKLMTLRSDPDFSEAQDVILLPFRRVIVCLPKYVLMVGEDDAIVIAGFRA